MHATARWSATLLPLLAALAGASPAPEGGRPNVIFLLTDDQRADTIAALGNPSIRTPNLDRIARSGFAFTGAYCLGGNSPAVCLPSRNMLLSGRTFFRFRGQAEADQPNLPAAMKAAGYDTYHHGKRGNTALEIQRLFDTSQYLDDQADRTGGEPGKQIVDEAIAFLRDRPADRPFFLYLAFANPHDPRVAAQPYRDAYRLDAIPLPPNYLPYHPFDNGELLVRDERLAPWPRTPEVVRKELLDYYAVITGLDGHIGRLLAALDAFELTDSTILVFSSDQGLAMGSHGLFGKQNLYEDGMRVPLIVAGPGIPRGRSDALVYLHDLFPTLCDLVGAPIPPGLDGLSLAPVLRGEVPAVRDALFTAYRDVQRGLRVGRWKLIRYPKADTTQLFDLETDPHEQVNLAGHPAYQARVAELMDRLRREQPRHGDDLPLTADGARPAPVGPADFPAPGQAP